MSADRVAEISVAIATRDRPQALARCLASLRDGRRWPAEVVVADQSAGVDSRTVAAGANSPELPVRWIDGGPDGLAGGQNAAFREATMPLVAVLDDDCVADVGWIEAIMRAFAADPALALVGGRVLPLPAAGDREVAVASRTSPTRRELKTAAAPWNVGSGNNFALRRDWFDRVGGGDERLGPGTRRGGRPRHRPLLSRAARGRPRAVRPERDRPPRAGHSGGAARAAPALRLRDGRGVRHPPSGGRPLRGPAAGSAGWRCGCECSLPTC